VTVSAVIIKENDDKMLEILQSHICTISKDPHFILVYRALACGHAAMVACIRIKGASSN
jgi:hypothetical protein